MPELDPEIEDRLSRVLTFLAVSGGAALLHRRRTGIVASVGEVDLRSAIAARHTAIAPTDQVISLNLQSLIADVSPEYRLLVHVPAGADHAFADRMKLGELVLLRLLWFSMIYYTLSHLVWGVVWFLKLVSLDFAWG